MLNSKNINSEDAEVKQDIGQSHAYFDNIKVLKQGQIVKGTIISISKKELIVDVGFKSEGIILLDEFPDKENIKVGNEIEVLIEKLENEEGMVVLSRNKAEKIMGWERIVNNYKEGDIISGKGLRKVKGGLMVNVGVEAFLPASQSTLRPPIDLNSLIGKELDYKIIKINKSRRNN